MKKYNHNDLAVNITLHGEGDVLFKTFKSIAQNITFLKKKYRQASVQINICLDNATEQTVNCFKAHKNILEEISDDFNVIEENFGDAAKARNCLIDIALKSNVGYVQIFDGDDLYTEDYLYNTYKLAKESKDPIVVVPEFLIDMYDREPVVRKTIARYKDSDDATLSLANLYSVNLWQSSIMMPIEVFTKIRYKECGSLYRYEDFTILLDIIAEGYSIKVAKDIAIVYRRKSAGSLLNQHISGSNLCLAPTKLFSPAVFSGLRLVGTNQKIENNKKAKCEKLAHLKASVYFLKRSIIECYLFVRGIAKFIVKLVIKDKYSKDRSNTISMTLLKKIVALNEIEPRVALSEAWPKEANIYINENRSIMDDVYHKLCRKFKDYSFDDLVILPHIVPGGADKAMIYLINEMSKNGRSILVVTTNNTKNLWQYKLDDIENVQTISFQGIMEEYGKINNDDISTMLLRIIQNWPHIKTVTVMGSVVGFDLIDKYSTVIRQQSQIFVFDWMYLRNKYGRIMPFNVDAIYPKIDKLLVDGEGYKRELLNTNGWLDDKKINVVSIPIGQVTSKKDYSLKKKIFFAGRFCTQKRIDCIIPILEKLNENGISIDFWGGIDTTDEGYTERRKTDMEGVKNAPNAEYRGPFNDFAKLPMDDYDLMIMPTEFEGLPNIVLEALKANMYVISGNAGSIPYVVKDYKNGYIVKDGGDAQGYLDAILDFYDNQSKILNPDERRKFNDEILKDHDIAVYEKTIAEIYGL